MTHDPSKMDRRSFLKTGVGVAAGAALMAAGAPAKAATARQKTITFPEGERPTSIRFEFRSTGPATLTLSPLTGIQTMTG